MDFRIPRASPHPGGEQRRKSGTDLGRLVLDPALHKVSRKYFVGCNAVPSSKESYDERKAATLWEVRAAMVNLRTDKMLLPPSVSGLAATQ